MQTAVKEPVDSSQTTLLHCFLHDHLREVMAVQTSVIESTLLGDEFVSPATSERLRFAASVYLSYADQIDARLTVEPAADAATN